MRRFIAEQLTLGKSLGDGSAVNGDERTIGTAALVVNCLGNQLLAYTALTSDKHGAVGLAGDFGKIQRFHHQWT